MAIQSFFEMFFGLLNNLFNTLSRVTLSAYGVEVPITVIFGAGIILVMIISLFWRGAKG